jgi:hypothetical protein
MLISHSVLLLFRPVHSRTPKELDDELIKLDREAFFKQFIHPSLKSTSNFIDMEKDESTMPMMTEEQIVAIVNNKEEVEAIDEVEKVEKETKNITSKEAIDAYNILSRYIENSKSYNDNKKELLKNVNDCIIDISAEKLQQKNLFVFF